MKKRTLMALALVIAMAGGLLAGCKTTGEPATETPVPTAQPVESVKPSEPMKPSEPSEQDAPFSFADLSDLEFWFGSGVGGWCTVLYIHADGTFEGQYHDSDMGDGGKNYPRGTRYQCDFTGAFTQPVKVDGHTYSVSLAQIEPEQEPGGEAIRDGVKIIYSTPYGLDDAEELLFYLPGAPVDALPEGYRDWMGGYGGEIGAELPFCGLYNVSRAQGFSSHKKATINDELAELEERAAELDGRLETEFTQADMREIAEARYQMWDAALNSIWGRLKETLDPETMAALTAEELDWIAYKEAEVQKAGAEVEGGTLQPMVELGTGAELTRTRVYELAEYLR